MTQIIAQYPRTLKSYLSDTDSPTISEAITGPHREEFIATIMSDTTEIESHQTLKTIVLMIG